MRFRQHTNAKPQNNFSTQCYNPFFRSVADGQNPPKELYHESENHRSAFDITEAIKNHVSKKLERINRHASDIISITVTLSVEKAGHKAEADVHLAGKDLHIESDGQDMYAAIDTLTDKIDRAVLKHKEKIGEVRN